MRNLFTFISNNPLILIVILVIVGGLIFLITGNELISGLFGGLGALLGIKKGANSVPIFRGQQRGTPDKNGFVQEDVVLTDDPGAGLPKPSGVSQNDVAVAVKTDPSVTVVHGAVKSKAQKARDMLRSKKQLVLVLLILGSISFSTPGYTAGPTCPIGMVCLTEQEAADLDSTLADFQIVEETAPTVVVLDSPILFIDSEHRVFTRDKLTLDTYWKDAAGNDIIRNKLDVALNFKVETDIPKPSWWDKNKFYVGFTVGGVTIGASILGILYLAGGAN